MDVLTYPIGLLIGLFPVVADLGNHPEPVQVLLDGRPGCVMSGRAPGCTLDLGPDPKLHRLELVRRDAKGRIVERAERWVNRPGIEAEVRAGGSCDPKTKFCELTINWAHPGHLDPSSIAVQLDGVTVSRGMAASLRIPFPGGRAPQVLTAEAAFPDGRKATFTRLLHGSYPEEAEASLQAIPIRAPPEISDEELAAGLREKGWPVRAIEKGSFEIDFVVEPLAFRSMSWWSIASIGIPATAPLEDAEAIHAIVANESMLSLGALVRSEEADSGTGFNGRRIQTIGGGRTTRPRESRPREWLRHVYNAAAAPLHRLRSADAVAAAGYALGGSPRRRAVVLIAGAGRPDESTFSPDQARSYLQQIGVPLCVWRLTEDAAPGWPEAVTIKSAATLVEQIRLLKQELERQRILWLAGRLDPRRLDWPLPEGVSLAGRENATGRSDTPAAGESENAAAPVFTVAVDPRAPERMYAGSRDGLAASSDGGRTWRSISTGAGASDVYALGFGLPNGELLVGTSGSIGHSIAGGENWALVPTLATFSVVVDPENSAIAYAATRGGLFRTLDGGNRWTPANAGLEHAFPVSLAADPRHSGVAYVATAGRGVFKTTNKGETWKATGNELDRTVVRSLAVDPSDGSLIYAATDGGVFASTNGGRSWKRASAGLPRAIVYAVRLAPRDPAHAFAGTAAGLFESRDRAASWNRVAAPGVDVAITALDVDEASGTIVAGTLDRGIFVLPRAPG